tara:strand:+ start:1691 stop:1849 length:159 start_codon:yes stop_codon:yes gene_type:complete
MSEEQRQQVIPQILKDLLNSEGYDSLQEALEDTARKIKEIKEQSEENEQPKA